MTKRAVREMPVAERPRERLAAHGPAALSSTELLAVLWGSGGTSGSSLDVAERIVWQHGSLGEIARADVLELVHTPGIGAARAAQLVAAFEIGRRSAAAPRDSRWIIRAPRDVCDRLSPEMAWLEREELRVLLLNAKNHVLRAVTVYQGNVSAALVRVAELFRDAVRIHAANLILVYPRREPDSRAQPPIGRPRAVTGRPSSHR
jgi:DNA repair protein RadC